MIDFLVKRLKLPFSETGIRSPATVDTVFLLQKNIATRQASRWGDNKKLLTIKDNHTGIGVPAYGKLPKGWTFFQWYYRQVDLLYTIRRKAASLFVLFLAKKRHFLMTRSTAGPGRTLPSVRPEMAFLSNPCVLLKK
ncbi:MAG TPA: hypothetical protein ENF48_01350 [Desulfobacteraceae bacterium]|nr:hypothetical protein [Desulfobacteraceae bacterium]